MSTLRYKKIQGKNQRIQILYTSVPRDTIL